ncbi:MAG TPA: metallophosphoesterase [Spirochaetia bacterium]|nr:metallophosphoesterase [Spirochaetia bacterium]
MKYRSVWSVLPWALVLLTAGCRFDWSGLLVGEDPDDRFERSMELNEGVERDIDSDVSYEFVVLGDVHAYEGEAQGLEAFYAWLSSSGLSPALLLFSGDLSDTGDEGDLALVKDLTGDGLIPAYFTLGNHDLLFDGYEAYCDIFGSSTYAFSCGPDLFICLDSANGTIGAEQMAWFRETLKTRRKDARYCFVFTHQNIFRYASLNFSYNQPIEEIYMLMDLYESYDVNYVFMGHDHRFDDRTVRGVHYITLDDISDAESHIILISVNADGISFSRIGL